MRKVTITCDLQKAADCRGSVDVSAADAYANAPEATTLVISDNAGGPAIIRVDACDRCRVELLKFLGQ